MGVKSFDSFFDEDGQYDENEVTFDENENEIFDQDADMGDYDELVYDMFAADDDPEF